MDKIIDQLRTHILSRLAAINNNAPDGADKKLIDMMLDIAKNTARATVFRAPMYVAGLIVSHIALDEAPIPDVYASTFFAEMVDAENSLVGSGRGLTLLERVQLKLSDWRGKI